MRMLFAALLLGLALPGAAQDRLVKFDLLATNGHDEPVLDLQSSDCQITEDGKKESIAFFHFVGSRVIPEGARSDHSNRTGARQPVIILLDLLSERELTWASAALGVAKAVEGLETGEDLYFYLLTNKGTIHPLHPLPKTDAEAKQNPADWSKQIQAIVDKASKEFQGFRPVDDRDVNVRAKMTLEAMTQFAEQMAPIPGRKNLIWITHGLPLYYSSMTASRVDLTPQLTQLSDLLQQAKVSVYAVAQSAAGAGANLGTLSGEMLHLMADQTGGRYYPSDSIGDAIKEARIDGRSDCEIGYKPRHASGDGKFHKLKVTCAARKEMKVRTKSGYFDSGGMETAEAYVERVPFDVAGVSLFDDPAIGLNVTPKPGAAAGKLHLDIQVDGADLLATSKLEVGFVLYDAAGGAQVDSSDAVEYLKDQLQNGKLAISRDVSVGRSIRKVRVVVFDHASKETGTVTIPVGRGQIMSH